MFSTHAVTQIIHQTSVCLFHMARSRREHRINSFPRAEPLENNLLHLTLSEIHKADNVL